MNRNTLQPSTDCPQCGTPYGEHARLGFCGRCAASFALGELTGTDSSEAALSAALPPSACRSSDGSLLGDYELLEEIGRGGTGVIFRARQRSLDRFVAIKLLLFPGLASSEQLERFRKEAASAAKIEHPNIVRVLDMGEHDGQPFIVMELVAGTDLGQLTQKRPLAAGRAAAYLETISRAVELAHQHGVLHRDLKPSNVLIDTSDQPRITDFGLSRDLAAPSELTSNGQILGSPSFMPPEQASGKTRAVGPASDVYGLGALLYHLLTSRPPFLADTLEATLLAVRESAPVPPRQLNPEIPRDLETICLKCLEKAPEQRYPTARELADELERFRNHQPILARPLSSLEKLGRWCRRHPSLAIAYGLVAALVSLVAVGGPILAFQLNQARKRAETETLGARRHEYTADMFLAYQALESRRYGRVLELLERHRPTAGSPLDLRGWEWRHLWHEINRVTPASHFESASHVWTTAWSDDGSLIAIGLAEPETAGTSLIRTWTPDTRTIRDAGTVRGQVRVIQPVRGPTFRVVSTDSRRLFFWDSQTDRRLEIDTGDDPAYAACLSANGEVVAASARTWVRAWRTDSGKKLGQLDPGGDGGAIDRGLALDPTGRRIAFYRSSDGSTDPGSIAIVLCDLVEGKTIAQLQGHSDRIHRLAFSPDGRLLASAGLDKSVRIWDLGTLREHCRLPTLLAPADALAFSSDGQTLATGSSDQPVDLWKTDSGRLLRSVGSHGRGLATLSFSPDDRRISTSGGDRPVKIWDASSVPQRSDFRENNPTVFATRFSQEGDTLWTFDGRNTVRLWNPRDLAEASRFELPSDSGGHANLSPAGTYFALQTLGEGFRVYATSPFRPVSDLPGTTNRVRRLYFAPDPKTLATVSPPEPGHQGGEITFWDWAHTEKLGTLKLDRANPAQLVFSRDARLLALGFADGAIEIWLRSESRKLKEFPAAHGQIEDMLFLSDGRRLASLASGTITIRDLDDPSQVRELFGPSLYSGFFSESPDGKRLAIGDSDGSITLWDLTTHTEVAVLRGHRDPLLAVSFQSDGNTLTSVSRDTLRVWRTAPLP